MVEELRTYLSDDDFVVLADMMGLADLCMDEALSEQRSEEFGVFSSFYTGLMIVLMRAGRYMEAKKHIAETHVELEEDEE